jgi:hypothetical protein
MSLSQKDNLNIAEYKTMENSKKVQCTKCGSIILKSSLTRHQKTKKCIGENHLIHKSSDRHESMREHSKKIRDTKISTTSIEQVREYEKLKKRKQRQDKKDGKPVRVRKQPDSKCDEALVEFNQAEKEVKMIDNKDERTSLIQVINEARKSVATGSKSFPEAKEIMKKKINKINEVIVNDTNIVNYAGKLDRTNLSNPSSKIEPKTIQNYLSSIGRIYKQMSGDVWDGTDFDWLNNQEAVEEHIVGMVLSDGTKRNYFNAIYSILKRIEGYCHLTPVYKRMLDRYNNLIDTQRGKNVMSKKEEKNIMSWNKIVTYNDKSWTDEARLLHRLYTSMPPRRLKDYSHMKYVRGKSMDIVRSMDKKYNYIVVNKYKNPISLVINNYKTKKRYGTFIVDLTQKDSIHFRYSEIKKAIKNFVKSSAIKSGELVFPNTKGDMYQDFTSWVHHLFKKTGRKISVNLLRHSFISDYLDDNPRATDNQIKKMSIAMGHKPETFRSYRKLDYVSGED